MEKIRHFCVNNKTALIIFAVALLARLAFLLGFDVDDDDAIRGDAAKYLYLAYNLITNGAYSVSVEPPFPPDTFITPGYPLFLAVVLYFSGTAQSFYFSAAVIQAVISSLSCVLMYRIAVLLLDRRLALCAALLASLSPHLIIFSAYLITETLFIFFLLAGIYMLATAWQAQHLKAIGGAGILFGIATLIRPGLMLYPVFLLVMLAFIQRAEFRQAMAARQFLKKSAVLLVCSSVLLVPWFVWSANQDVIRNDSPLAAQLALGSYPNLVFMHEELRGFPSYEDPQYGEMIQSPGAALGIIWNRVKADPWPYVKWYLFGKALVYHQPNLIVSVGGPFIYPYNSTIYDLSPLANMQKTLMLLIHPLLVLMAALVGIRLIATTLTSGKARPDFALLTCFSVVLYFTLLHMVLAPLPRYSIPLHPFIFILAMALIQALLPTYRGMTWQKQTG